jgi:RluA family pseudouridine synthase
MIEILLEDPWFLVINKPPHLLSQALPTIPSVQSQLIEQLADQMPSTPFVGIPHRLDRMTSGVMVIARNQSALKRLCEQFASRKVSKRYLAWVHGIVPESARWEDYMRKVPDQPRAEMVAAESEVGRIAALSFERLQIRDAIASGQAETLGSRSLVKVELETGRMHQIRLQFGARGHAILGDALYGSECSWGERHSDWREPPIGLHACRLQFFHPKTGEATSVCAKPPQEFPWEIDAAAWSAAVASSSRPKP